MIVRASALKTGDRFVTLLTKRTGFVLEDMSAYGALPVQISPVLPGRDTEIKNLHSNILVDML